MSVHMNIQELEKLHKDIHRLASERVNGATLEAVEKILKTFHDRNATRLDFAFKIYWQLQEDQIFWPCHAFLERLEEEVRSKGPGAPKARLLYATWRG